MSDLEKELIENVEIDYRLYKGYVMKYQRSKNPVIKDKNNDWMLRKTYTLEAFKEVDYRLYITFKIESQISDNVIKSPVITSNPFDYSENNKVHLGPTSIDNFRINLPKRF
jgi:hypothetical protein